MDDRDLDEFLKRYANASVPALPGSFPQNVLREIRLRRGSSRQKEGWLSELYTLFFRPGFMAASFSLAIVVGFAFPAMMRPANPALTANSLGLDVFSHSMVELPSTPANAQ
jgi:anti-sigma factor RsiW